MNNILAFSDFIGEQQTVHQYTTAVAVDADNGKVEFTQLIHHYTTTESLVKILESNTLKKGDAYEEHNGAVSLTLNASVPNTLEDLDLTCRITLDREKLIKDYKLIPFLYIPKKKDFSWECVDEMEEQVRKEITNLSKYIVEIRILDKKIFTETKKDFPNLPIKNEKF